MADTTRPHGTLTGPINFAAHTANPYGLADAGSYASPSFVDIDGDGDLDALVGNREGNTLVQLNTGSNIQPAFGAVVTNPYGLANVGTYASPRLVDIDGDGDLDAVISNNLGNTVVQLNTGSRTSPAFATGTTNPYGLANAGAAASAALVDIDGDGDLDALIGNSLGSTALQLNTGSATRPAFAAATPNPYGLADSGTYASASFADIDTDGDLDALYGYFQGNVVLQLNTGNATSPAFAAATTRPYNLSFVTFSIEPAFVDIDADGDLDALIGNSLGNISVQLNMANPTIAITPTTANGTYGVGSVITITIAFNEVVNVVGTPSIALETGSTDRAAVYTSGSGTTTLTFSYTVRAGDTSADLDVVNASALKLNGGSITDAAGNNAVLTLAAPGATGSLGANANIVIDGVAPRGALTFIPVLAAATINPYGLADVGFGASPRFVDIDGDGDLDALIGERYGNTLLHLNTGSASSPAFATATTNPYGLSDVGTFASLSLVDIDGDGDLDALIGERNGNVVVQLNLGSATSPAFGAATNRPYGLVNVGFYASPSFGDIDGDGDLDALIGNSSGNNLVQLNTGSATSPTFGAATTNPYGLRFVDSFASPSLLDIDGDGDLDVLIGNLDGNTLVQLNTGSATRPAFGAATTNPYGLGSVTNLAVPTMVDIDSDGDLDVFIGNGAGNTVVHLNTANPVAPVTSSNANRAYGVGSVITLTVAFNEAVLVTGTPTLLLETGATDRTATYASGSGTNTLTFTYTVQAGDISADLDQFSSTALALNGGTIRDAAGNNAILTLAAPAGQGSLGANKAIVIDGVAPTVAITSNVAAVKIGETSTITFTFSEDPGASFVAGDITTTTGTLGAITGAGLTRTATFTPAANTTANASITVAAASYTDAAGNTGGAGITPALAIDTQAPTVAITSNVPAVKIGETATITFTFSEDPGASFAAGDITTIGGSLGALSGAGLTRTATFTPKANTAANASITVAAASYTDAAGNTGSAGSTPTLAVETTRPVFASATVNGNRLVLTYTDASNLDAANPPPVGAFAVLTAAAPNAVTAVAVNAVAKTVTLTLASAVTSEQGVSVAYTDPSAADDANAIQDAAGNDAASLPVTLVANATAAPPAPPTGLDADGDGVPNTQENQARPPTASGLLGDGNGDGLSDSGQANVSSAQLPGSTRFVTVVADSNKGITDTDTGQAVITNFKIATPVNLPALLNLSSGAISFNAAIGATGQTETFSIFVDATTNPNGYWVQNKQGVWNNIATAIEQVGDKVRIDFAITDGGPFDADGAANGSIAVTGGAGNLPLTLIGLPPDLPSGSFWF